MSYYIDLKSISIDQFRTILKTMHLIPSWKILGENVDNHLDAIKKQGIDNLEELLIALKNKEKQVDFARKSKLSEKYLAVLNRVVKGYRPKPNRWKDFSCISEDTINKLSSLKINNTLKLYPEIITPEKRNQLSKKIEISGSEILKLAKLADLSRIRWVNHTFAYVLLEAGYDTVEKVAGADDLTLHQEIKELNAKRKIYNAHIGKNDMKMVIEFAKNLSFEVEYDTT